MWFTSYISLCIGFCMVPVMLYWHDLLVAAVGILANKYTSGPSDLAPPRPCVSPSYSYRSPSDYWYDAPNLPGRK